jgi:hypothetical protein
MKNFRDRITVVNGITTIRSIRQSERLREVFGLSEYQRQLNERARAFERSSMLFIKKHF